MSDNLRFVLIVTEGPHDVAAIEKVYRLRGYRELNYWQEIPDELKVFIPTRYPFNTEGWMSRGVPRPSFLNNDNQYIVIDNAGGISKIAAQLSKDISVLYERVLQKLCGIAIVVDMDYLDQKTRRDQIIDQLRIEMDDTEIQVIEPGKAVIKGEKDYPLLFFFFPDNISNGTLETILLDGAETSYSDLLVGAQKYINGAKNAYSLERFDDLKAIVGAIANVLKPGKANQVSIHDSDWITEKSILELTRHKSFATFLDSVGELLLDKEDH